MAAPAEDHNLMPGGPRAGLPQGDYRLVLSTLAFVTSAALLGGMLYFALGFAPLVFTRLPAETAARFIRAVFPVYYAMGAGTALLATLLLLPTGRWAALALAAVVAGGFLLARFVLMPAINAARPRDRGRRRREPPLRQAPRRQRRAERGAGVGAGRDPGVAWAGVGYETVCT